jgi:hypothetical protein
MSEIPRELELRVLQIPLRQRIADLEARYDELLAISEKMREALNKFPAATAEVGDEGGWVYIKNWEALSDSTDEALKAFEQFKVKQREV